MFKKMLFVLSFIFLRAVSFATGAGGMVWEKPATTIQKSISGPMAGVVAIVVIVVAALTWAMSDGGNMMGRAIKIVCAFAIVGGAVLFVSSVFGINTSGGMLI